VGTGCVMKLRVLGLMLNVGGVAGLAVAAMARDDSARLFTLRAGAVLAAGMTCLAVGRLRDGYRQRLRSVAPDARY
jgi:hypothetical protein